MSAPNRYRVFVTCCSIAAVTIVGTLYGAQMKTTSDAKKARAGEDVDGLAAQIAALERKRGSLVAHKMELEQKIARVKEREEKRPSPRI